MPVGGGARKTPAVACANEAAGPGALLPRRQAAAWAAALLGGCALTPAQDPGLAQAVEARLQPLLDARLFSGAVVLMRRGRQLVARGWGQANHAEGIAFTPQTPCDAASLAKNFTAAGVWLLVHEGRLSLNQPVQPLVPEYPHAGVTVAHLLWHTNGLAPDYGSFDRHFAPGQLRETRALLRLAGQDTPVPAFAPGSRFAYSDLAYDALALVIEQVSGQGYAAFVRQRFFQPHGLAQAFAPGSRFAYSDLAYDALALVIEQVSGQGYAAFVRQRFFQPHGLAQAFARPPRLADWPGPRTRGYRFADGRWQDNDLFDGEAFLGGSNLHFSALDLARWGDAWAQARVLPAAADRAGAERPVLGGERSAIDALGWFAPAAAGEAPAARSGHNTGNYNGFRASLHWHRGRREVVALVSNSSLPQAEGDALLGALVALLAGPVPPPVRR
jgi:CubicO group peptidase (beta-lactamase class C family)